ncbi:hypothetical protein DICA2_F29822 [Diutina catenulata]
MRGWGIRQPVRMFHASRPWRKDEKSKQLLKDLGLSLQKGQIAHEDEPEIAPHSPPQSAPHNSQNSQQQLLSHYYDTVSHMTCDDLAIQLHCDSDRQLFSSASGHYLDRKSMIRDLPDSLDLFNPDDMAKIDDVYAALEKLDEDDTVHAKYFQRYLTRYDDPVQLLIQKFNGIDKKFKLLRRKEIDSLSLAPGAYLYHENLFGVPYNVVGFDRSISGLPLRKSGVETCYPQEFIEDLQSFRTTIPVHKRDLDFISVDSSTVLVDPKKVTKHYTSKLERINSYLKKLDAPPNSISVASIDGYRQLALDPDVVARIDTEILLVRKSLVHEISTVLKAGSPATRHVEFAASELKHNLYRLCESQSRSTDTIFEFRHLDKQFNPVPNYAMAMRTVKHRRQLKRHLAKLFLINCEEQIDILTRIKYLDDRAIDKFMAKLVHNIGNVVKYKLMPLFKPVTVPRGCDAWVFAPYSAPNPAFKRLHWVNRWKHTDRGGWPMRRGTVRCNWRHLDDY